MYNKKYIIKSLESIIENNSRNLSIEEVESLKQIKEQISKSTTEADLLQWTVVIFKVFDILKDIF